MIPVLTGAESRRLDRQAIHEQGIPSLELMEAAGRGAYEFLENVASPLKNQRVLILCGKGNNGGDGFVIARYLKQEGITVELFVVAPVKDLSPDAQQMARRFHKLGGTIHVLSQDLKLETALTKCDLVVDALLGTGLKTVVRSPDRKLIAAINKSGLPALALDIPSGLCADTGQVLGEATRARWTATMGTLKLGLVLSPGCDYAGQIEIIDIGLPQTLLKKIRTPYRLITAETVRSALKARAHDSHKGHYGHVLVASGSPTKLGAPLLAAKAALRMGAGLVTLALPQAAYQKIPQNFLELMYEPIPASHQGYFTARSAKPVLKLSEAKQALAVGPGMGVTQGTRAFMCSLLKKIKLPTILDADALNALTEQTELLRAVTSPMVLTPHPGEMARLTHQSTTEVQKKRLQLAQEFAQSYGVHLVLKGYRTLIATPEGKVYLNPTGGPTLSAAGMGDVLTGMIAGAVAQGVEWTQAICVAVYLHGLAGDRLNERMGDRGVLAGDVCDFIPFLLKDFLRGWHELKRHEA